MSDDNGHKRLTREDFLALTPRLEPYDSDTLGGRVWLRVLNLRDRDRLLSAARENTELFPAMTVFFSVCNERGERLFTDERDIARIAELAGAPLMPIALEALRLNGLLVGQFDELKKTSSTTPTSDSVIASPVTSV